MSTALQPQPALMTLEEYEALPPECRVEVYEGIVYDMASPSQIHQIISVELTAILINYIKSKKGLCRVFHAPFDVKLEDDPLTIVQPDLMIICDRDKLDKNRCNGAPDFVIEIVSPSNASDDYVRKLYYYKNHKVREYWIIDPQQEKIFVNYFEGESFFSPYSFTSKIKVNIFDDLEIDFSDIFASINA